jgi:hypothetical protein
MSDFLIKAYLFCSLLILVFCTSDSFGSESEWCSPDERLAFKSVQISGNEKTSTQFIEMELGLSDKEGFCENQIREKIYRLKRTGLFSKVEYTITRQNQNDLAELRIAVIEKWTTIPILKLNSGGGVSQYTLGAYDPNGQHNFRKPLKPSKTTPLILAKPLISTTTKSPSSLQVFYGLPRSQIGFSLSRPS